MMTAIYSHLVKQNLDNWVNDWFKINLNLNNIYSFLLFCITGWNPNRIGMFSPTLVDVFLVKKGDQFVKVDNVQIVDFACGARHTVCLHFHYSLNAFLINIVYIFCYLQIPSIFLRLP